MFSHPTLPPRPPRPKYHEFGNGTHREYFQKKEGNHWTWCDSAVLGSALSLHLHHRRSRTFLSPSKTVMDDNGELSLDWTGLDRTGRDDDDELRVNKGLVLFYH
mmetsp:Transcript_13964/g.15292  ORF Transcript_13964/g.15292 Transcript_13964/m.15292 type:complete len:104 (+) Transcript_13964:104-415(+)